MVEQLLQRTEHRPLACGAPSATELSLQRGAAGWQSSSLSVLAQCALLTEVGTGDTWYTTNNLHKYGSNMRSDELYITT